MIVNKDEEEEKMIKRVVDVGCGIGGSSRYLASKFGAECIGITLSPFQAKRANELAAAQSLSNKVFFLIRLISTGFVCVCVCVSNNL